MKSGRQESAVVAVASEMEGLAILEADLVVFVHPSKADKPHSAVLRQLSTFLFMFDETYDGVLLAYSFKIENTKAKILSGLIPYFGVNIKAKLLLFSPKPNMLLEGKVVKLGKESIHLVVLGICSAAITFEDIRQEFVYTIKNDEGVFASTAHRKHVIKPGSMLRFLVKSLDEEILHVAGSLVPAHTGCIRWLSKHNTEDLPIDRSLKRHRNRDSETEIQEQDHGVLSEGDPSTPKKSRRTP